MYNYRIIPLDCQDLFLIAFHVDKYFDERIVGLTSDKNNLDRLHEYFKTKYDLLYSKDENYLVEHSSNLYVIDTNMIVDRIIANGLPNSEITKAVKKLIDRI